LPAVAVGDVLLNLAVAVRGVLLNLAVAVGLVLLVLATAMAMVSVPYSRPLFWVVWETWLFMDSLIYLTAFFGSGLSVLYLLLPYQDLGFICA